MANAQGSVTVIMTSMDAGKVPEGVICYSAVIEGGVRAALCSPAHLARWEQICQRRGVTPGIIEKAWFQREACAYCLICGTLVAKPPHGTCMLHGDDCPPMNVEATDTVATVVRALEDAGLPLPLTDEQYEYVIDTANMLYMFKGFSGHELYLRCREGLL